VRTATTSSRTTTWNVAPPDFSIDITVRGRLLERRWDGDLLNRRHAAALANRRWDGDLLNRRHAAALANRRWDGDLT
jgi:hypothetical protein